MKARVVMDYEVGRDSRKEWAGREIIVVSILAILSELELWENLSISSVRQLK